MNVYTYDTSIILDTARDHPMTCFSMNYSKNHNKNTLPLPNEPKNEIREVIFNFLTDKLFGFGIYHKISKCFVLFSAFVQWAKTWKKVHFTRK